MQVSFLQFLSKANDPAWLMQYPVLYFKGTSQDCPILFFSFLNNKIKQQNILLESLSIDSDESVVRAKMHTSFLGMKSYYWLHGLSLTDKQSNQWITELGSYEGPNTVGFYVPDTVAVTASATQCVVELPSQVDQKMFAACMQFFNKKAVSASALSKLCAGNQTFSLESACLLMQYVNVLGVQVDSFVTELMPKLLPVDNSLFTLSTHFFAKKPKLFFELLQDMGSEYGDVFWVSYWSEQLWRAFNFIDLTTKKQHGDAKKISMRLPFSFMQRDWRQTSLIELKTAHNYVYTLDYNIKNGGSPVGLELFYSKFFAGEFKQN